MKKLAFALFAAFARLASGVAEAGGATGTGAGAAGMDGRRRTTVWRRLARRRLWAPRWLLRGWRLPRRRDRRPYRGAGWGWGWGGGVAIYPRVVVGGIPGGAVRTTTAPATRTTATASPIRSVLSAARHRAAGAAAGLRPAAAAGAAVLVLLPGSEGLLPVRRSSVAVNGCRSCRAAIRPSRSEASPTRRRDWRTEDADRNGSSSTLLPLLGGLRDDAARSERAGAAGLGQVIRRLRHRQRHVPGVGRAAGRREPGSGRPDPRGDRAAAIGTLLGAGTGAAIGAAYGNPGAGAAIGGGTGLVLGGASGVDSGQSWRWELQRRYDNAFQQCMYAKGNQIPVSAGSQPATTRTEMIPPPPPGPPPPPPPQS